MMQRFLPLILLNQACGRIKMGEKLHRCKILIVANAIPLFYRLINMIFILQSRIIPSQKQSSLRGLHAGVSLCAGDPADMIYEFNELENNRLKHIP